MLASVLNSEAGSILVSIIIGLGLASFFKKVCKDGRCIVIKGPDVNEIQKNVYKIDNECYTYTPTATQCK